MNRYILSDFGFFSTKIYIVGLDFMVQQCYFELPNISDESAREKICEFISKNVGKDFFLNLIIGNLLLFLIQWQNGSNLIFLDQEYGNEIMTKILSQIPAGKSFNNCYFELNGQTNLEKMLAKILMEDSHRFAKKLYNWNKLLIEPLVSNNYYKLS